MADSQGKVRIGISFDSKEALNDVKKIAQAFMDLGQSILKALDSGALEAMADEAATAAEAVEDVGEAADDAAEKVEDVAEALDDVADSADKATDSADFDKLENDAEAAADAVEKVDDALDDVGNNDGIGDDPDVDDYRQDIQQLASEVRDLIGELRNLKSAQDDALDGDAADGGGKGGLFGKVFGGIGKAGAGVLSVFGAIKSGAGGLKDYIGEKFAPTVEMLKHIGETLMDTFVFDLMMSALDAAKEKLGEIIAADAQLSAQISTIKGNISAAFSPLWEAVYPAVVQILNVVTAITSAIANLSAKIFGGSKAATGALTEEAEAIGAVGSAAASASQELGGFDEINTLSSSGGGGGGGGGAGGGLTEGVMTDLSWTMEDLYNRMMALDWEMIAGRINGALLSIDFETIGAKIAGGVSYVMNALETVLDGIDWEQLGRNIADGLNELTKALPDIGGMLGSWFDGKIELFYGIITGYDWNGLGTAIGTSLNNFVDDIDTGMLGAGISNLATGILDAISSALQTLNWVQLGDKVVDFITTIPWLKVASKAAAVIKDALGAVLLFAGSILDGLTNALAEVNWAEAGQNIVDRIKVIPWGHYAFQLALAVKEGLRKLSTFAATLLRGLGEAIANIDWQQLGSDIVEAIKNIDWGLVIDGIIDAITYGLQPLEDLLNDFLEWVGIDLGDGLITSPDKAAGSDVKQPEPPQLGNMSGMMSEWVGSMDTIAQSTDGATMSVADLNTEIDKAYALFRENGDVDAYRATLEALGLDAETVGSYMQLLSEDTAAIASNTGAASASVDDIAEKMDDAADAANTMSKSTKKVTTNTDKATVSLDDEVDALYDIDDAAKDAITANADLATSAEDMAEATDDGIITMAEALQQNLRGWNTYASQLTAIMSSITAQQAAFWNNVSKGAVNAVSGIKQAFATLPSTIGNAFESAWKRVISAMSNGGSSFSAITDGLERVFRNSLNSMISGLNRVFEDVERDLNVILVDIKRTKVGTIKPFSNIGTVNLPSIPKLAKGAVIPANNEFLAILGDQKQGTNIEAPLDTIVEAMEIALQSSGGTANAEAIAAAVRAALAGMAVTFDREKVGRVVAAQIDANRRADGKFAYDLA